MPRTAHLAPHLTSQQLETRYRTATNTRDARHWQLLWQVSLQNTIQDAAQIIVMHYDQARNLIRKYNQHGPDSIPDKRKTRSHTPRKPLLDQTQRQKLFQALQAPHPDGGLWTGPKVARWIQQATGRERVVPQLGWDYLKRLGFSLQQPRPRHQQASQEAQEAFKKSS
jgi:transposase